MRKGLINSRLRPNFPIANRKDSYIMQKVSLPSQIPPDKVAIATNQVSYQTKFRTLLMDISVEIIKGSKTALIGATGSGKTTFLRLLNRLADPSVGAITWQKYSRNSDSNFAVASVAGSTGAELIRNDCC